jgi:hypothetical protein
MKKNRKQRFDSRGPCGAEPSPGGSFPRSALRFSWAILVASLREELLQFFRQQIALAAVLGHRKGALQLFARFGKAAQLYEQVCPDAGEEMIAGQRRFSCESVERVESSGGAV